MSGRAAVHVVERRFELHQIFGLMVKMRSSCLEWLGVWLSWLLCSARRSGRACSGIRMHFNRYLCGA